MAPGVAVTNPAYVAGGLPMDGPGHDVGQNDGFDVRAPAVLEEVVRTGESDSLPRCASFDEGMHKKEVLAAVAESTTRDGGTVRVLPQREPVAMSEAGAR